MLVQKAVEQLDRASGVSPLVRKQLRYLFPDHWSFLLGEVALYAFVILVITGTYLTFFFVPSFGDTVYHGPYVPLDGMHMSEAYESVINISFDYRAGLLIRQTHHWAADIFVAAIVVHLMRVFFTGAYRRPRELTWLVGLGLLTVALLEGYAGYSMVDDLLSGMGLAIGYGVALSIPFFGANLAAWLWGSPYPGLPSFESRLYIAHVFILPGLLAAMLGAHLGLVAWRHHTQFPRRRRKSNLRIVGVPAFPGQAPRSIGLFFAVAALLFLLGGEVQINPVWQWGPYEVYRATNGAQPDWYLGWLIGALRLVPSFDWVIDGYTVVPNPFWGGVVFPGIVFTVLGAWPMLERRRTGDHAVHNALDRLRDAPRRTGFGFAMLTWVILIFVAGSADRAYVFFGVPYVQQIWVYRVLVWVAPVFVYFVVRHVCRELQKVDALEERRELAEEHAEERAEEEAGSGIVEMEV